MLCDKCKKNEATIHIKNMHNGEVTECNLCAQCAEKMDQTDPIALNLTEILFNLGQIGQKIKPSSAPVQKTEDGECAGHQAPASTCPCCGWTEEKVRQCGGLLGCTECYKTFSPMLNHALRNVHRGVLHMGKRPKRHAGNSSDAAAMLKKELELSQQQLQEFIRKEDYESAAQCRDRINSLKQEIKEQEK